MLLSTDEEMARLGAMLALKKGHRWCARNIPSTAHNCMNRLGTIMTVSICDCNVMPTNHHFTVYDEHRYRYIYAAHGFIIYGFNHKKYQPLASDNLRKVVGEDGNVIYKPKGQKNASNISRSISPKK